MPVANINPNDPWLDAKEAAQHLKIGVKALYFHVAKGRIPVSTLGRTMRFKASQMDKALLSQSSSHDIEATQRGRDRRCGERVVLGGLLIDNSLIADVIHQLLRCCFFDAAHREIFAVICDLYKLGSPVDLVTLRDELTKRGKIDEVGGVAYISGLLTDVSAGTDVRYHAGILAERARLRCANDMREATRRSKEHGE